MILRVCVGVFIRVALYACVFCSCFCVCVCVSVYARTHTCKLHRPVGILQQLCAFAGDSNLHRSSQCFGSTEQHASVHTLDAETSTISKHVRTWMTHTLAAATLAFLRDSLWGKLLTRTITARELEVLLPLVEQSSMIPHSQAMSLVFKRNSMPWHDALPLIHSRVADAQLVQLESSWHLLARAKSDDSAFVHLTVKRDQSDVLLSIMTRQPQSAVSAEQRQCVAQLVNATCHWMWSSMVDSTYGGGGGGGGGGGASRVAPRGNSFG